MNRRGRKIGRLRRSMRARIGANEISRRMSIGNIAALVSEIGSGAIQTWIGWRGCRYEKQS
jgi:hypothetical protein